MNFLAHAHLARFTDSSVVGNLLGDFTRGLDVQTLPPEWQLGIRLHRKIDLFTDSHPEILALRSELGELRRYGGIILDILLDHVLACEFDALAGLNLAEFAASVYAEFRLTGNPLPPDFNSVARKMASDDWLFGYRDLNRIALALEKTSLRLSRRPPLTESLIWYESNRPRIDEIAIGFYGELKCFSRVEYRRLLET